MRTPDSVNVEDRDTGDLFIYAYADDETYVCEQIPSFSPEPAVRAAQERVAADVNRLNEIASTCRQIREEKTAGWESPATGDVASEMGRR